MTPEQIDLFARKLAESCRGLQDPARALAERLYDIHRTQGWNMSDVVEIGLAALTLLRSGNQPDPAA